jgi:hypothetical protein
MQIRARISPFIRPRQSSRLFAVLRDDFEKWPVHLRAARAILIDLGLSVDQTQVLLSDVITLGLDCAHQLNRRAEVDPAIEQSARVAKAFERLARCTKRAPAQLRRLLDEETSVALQDGDVNLEVVESLIRAARRIFEQFRENEAAKTALSSLRVGNHGRMHIGLIDDFSSLAPALHDTCMTALAGAIGENRRIEAEIAFRTLGEAIPKPQQPTSGAADIVIAYVAEVACAWRGRGLNPGRANKSEDPRYTSKFHHFCDLVLTAVAEPNSRRHDEGLDHRSKQAWTQQRRLPAGVRRYVRGGLPLRDAQWLVTAHCLREGLRRANSKKSVPDSI